MFLTGVVSLTCNCTTNIKNSSYILGKIIIFMGIHALYSLPDPLNKNKNSIREHLARMIIEGTIKRDGILPNELDLAKGFGVSRTMVRDVLRSLEEKGLIERKAHVGTRVRSIHSWNLLDSEVLDWGCGVLTQPSFLGSLLELRLLIEPQAAALAAIRANHVELQLITSTFEEMVTAGLEEEGLRIDPEVDIAFHQAIIMSSGNLFISQFGGVIRAALYHTISLSGRAAGDHAESIESHRRLLNSIENRNSAAAYAAMVHVLKKTMADMNIQGTGVILADHENG